ncbi:hypothetical protein I4U23_006671 [Adineta vaga]|nr:hypothetical protein I4U23_006671 [Adineta vaga]
MDVIITALGEFVWTASCAVINFCVSSGFSASAVFVSFLCVILASAFYKYSTSREEISLLDNTSSTFVDYEDDNLTPSNTIAPIMKCPMFAHNNNNNNNTNHTNDTIQSLSEIEICVEENASETEANDEEISDDILIDTIEGSEDEIQKKQIANIYRLLNDQHLINNWTTTDFLDQLKMYGLETYEDDELEVS